MMKKKIPILLLTRDRPNLLEKVLKRVIQYTNWEDFELWILDNLCTASNKKIIKMYKELYPFINVYSTTYNQLALIQNEVIRELKAEVFIKIDDDILVSEGWTDAFLGVYERNHQNIGFGSVIIPINGFGWVPFLKIMGLEQTFVQNFPGIELQQQDALKAPVFKDRNVSEFIWNKCLDLDETVQKFKENQEGKYVDLYCTHRYSIGAIIFSYKRWEEMGGWKVQDGFEKNLRKQKIYQKGVRLYKKLRGSDTDKYTKLNLIADMMAGVTEGAVGLEEETVCEFCINKGYTIPVTTQGMVFHFAFGPVDDYLMSRIYPKMKV